SHSLLLDTVKTRLSVPSIAVHLHIENTTDDLTDTIFAGHHQPLKVWVLCLYFMGLNVSNEQIAHELSINESDAYQMTTALRGGIVKKASSDPLQRGGVR